jgi:hypothetical protein
MNYHEKRKDLITRINALPRGTRFKISQALQTHNTLISSTLNGVLFRPDLLERIARVVEQMEVKDGSASISVE